MNLTTPPSLLKDGFEQTRGVFQDTSIAVQPLAWRWQV
jgi:hypothetical protein